jgi:hypothetical protein
MGFFYDVKKYHGGMICYLQPPQKKVLNSHDPAARFSRGVFCF